MPPLVVALALTAVAPLPPPPQVVFPSLRQAFELTALACRDIDPRFVIDVAPPAGRGPLWAIDRSESRGLQLMEWRGGRVGPMPQARAPSASASDACPHLRHAAG